MQAHITRTKGWLQAQAQKQQDAHVQLKSYIDDEIRAVHERISAQIRDSQLGLKACVDSLGRNVQDLKDAMRWVSWCQSPPASKHECVCTADVGPVCSTSMAADDRHVLLR